MSIFKTLVLGLFLTISILISSQNRQSYADKSQREREKFEQLFGSSTPTPIIESQGKITDVDGNEYKTVKVGTEIWMAENLKVTHYRNGDSIPNVIDATTWSGLKTGAWCEYDNDHSNGEKYGKLYNFFALSDKRNISPKGWHVATNAEWEKLKNYLAGRKVIVKGKETKEILDPNNEMGFNLCGGFRAEEFVGNTINIYWNSTSYDNKTGMSCIIVPKDDRLMSGEMMSNDFEIGMSVRCVKDSEVKKVTASQSTSQKPKTKRK